jgi:hypothetical protein
MTIRRMRGMRYCFKKGLYQHCSFGICLILEPQGCVFEDESLVYVPLVSRNIANINQVKELTFHHFGYTHHDWRKECTRYCAARMVHVQLFVDQEILDCPAQEIIADKCSCSRQDRVAHFIFYCINQDGYLNLIQSLTILLMIKPILKIMRMHHEWPSSALVTPCL